MLLIIYSFFGYQEEFAYGTVGEYLRTKEEVVDVLMDKTSCVYKEGLHLVSVETFLTRYPFKEEWMNASNANGKNTCW